MGPAGLSAALKKLNMVEDPNLLVGLGTSDDAGVYRLNNDLAIVNTVDFITPPVDDPYWFGQIAAANSISDVYSMGGEPLTALNLVMFPAKVLDIGVLQEILKGGYDKLKESGAALLGGHSVEDDEPKYGMSVTGTIHPNEIWTNAGAQKGDALILTKPLGSGVLFNANRARKFDYKKLEREVLPVIGSLNKAAKEVAKKYKISACTDVTGFGIMGHALEMAEAAKLSLILDHKSLPFFDGALDMYKIGQTTGSNKANRALLSGKLKIETSLSTAQNELLFDPQTSGGLLFSLPKAEADGFLKSLQESGVTYAVKIGEVGEESSRIILH
ncbi:MAG: selenide, water dikinase SelD [SAR324 cluster bacterium]|nr:selenide, water dikinase SelD [SAR324 cluster bacterium]